MSGTCLSVRDLRVDLGGRSVLAGVDLDVEESEIVVVVGPSGCGKSTLLRALAGLVPAQGGSMTIEGEPIVGPSSDRALVFQEDALLPWRTVLANVELPLALRGVPRRERRQRSLAVLDDVGLEGFERYRPAHLSGGMRQRVQIARTLVGRPRVVLMDEPFGALDARARAAAQDLLLDVWGRRRCTVVFVTHDVDEALLLADRVVVMSARPGLVRAVLDVPSPRSTGEEGQEREAMRRTILRLLDAVGTDRPAATSDLLARPAPTKHWSTGAPMRPELSVVVPVYDVENYLEACLTSLARQVDDIEVLLVDDGSTDRSADIARRWAEDDTRFRVLTQEHAGLSAARNRGTAAATGRHLAFCDADDVVPDGAYRALLRTLASSGSDMASGDVRRLDSSGVRPHPRYKDVFAETRTGTHITRDPRLVLDRMSWNKVFVRSFWDSAGLQFALAQYEDAPVMVRAHLLARSVDVLDTVVYHWRIREDGPQSITQRLLEPDNVAARMTMMIETGQVFRDLAPHLLEPFSLDMMRGDVMVAVRAVPVNGREEILPALRLAAAFVEKVDADVLDLLSPDDRQVIDRVRALDVDWLRQQAAASARG